MLVYCLVLHISHSLLCQLEGKWICANFKRGMKISLSYHATPSKNAYSFLFEEENIVQYYFQQCGGASYSLKVKHGMEQYNNRRCYRTGVTNQQHTMCHLFYIESSICHSILFWLSPDLLEKFCQPM